MTLKDSILDIMRTWAPEDSAESWDNVGLQIDMNADIQRVALALEINLDTWFILKDKSYDLIITHHPLIFSPIRQISMSNWVHQVMAHLLNQDIGLYVSHTNLDKAVGGVNDALVAQYDLEIDREKSFVDGFGKVVYLNQPITVEYLAEKVQMMANVIPDNIDIRSIAFCAGSGKSFVNDVINQNVDLYITGELGYHDIQTLRQQGIGIILLGHYQSEVFVLDRIKNKLSSLDVACDIIK